jgi:uncharacterized protein
LIGALASNAAAPNADEAVTQRGSLPPNRFIFTEAEMINKPAARISYEDRGHKGRFVARVDGVEGEGELTVSTVSNVLVIADHTFVPDTFRGTGVASALVGALIADARTRGYRIVPLCPFVRAQSLKHPEWADVFQH